MAVLKSLTFTTLPTSGGNPILDRRARAIARLEEQKLILKDPNYTRTVRNWVKRDGERVMVEKQQRVPLWWRQQRQRRETSFFLRNRRLVKRAKQKLGTACQCCKFTFSSKYGAIGDGFIECHHLKPISEKYGQDQSSLKTNLNDVAVLCANCHRMIHRMMHKEKRWIGLEEFTEFVHPST
jgi:hypothetical protein